MFKGITDNPQHSQWIFYDTHFTRNDILNLIKLENQPEQFRKYIIESILVNWIQKDASENRNEVFVDQLCQLYRFMNSQNYTAEQKSTLMSLAYEIFIKSMEKKMTQIDSFNLLKQALNEQTKIFSTQTIPIFTQQHCKNVIDFIKGSFYRYYSLYELTMTKFIDLNIYSNYKFDNNFPQLQSLSSGKKIDNPAELPALKYLFNEIQENENEDGEDHQEDLHQTEQEQENIDQDKDSPKKRILTGEDLLIQQYVDNKLNNYNHDISNKVVQSQEQVLEQAQNIINPPKKK
ncbi:hypothetical protein ABPG72_003108 [Tetrahymena utriculariae]